MIMIKKTLTLIAVLAAALTSAAQVKVSVHETAKDQPVIPAEIYGQFSEHLGKCIYEGIWVGTTGWTASARRKTARSS